MIRAWFDRLTRGIEWLLALAFIGAVGLNFVNVVDRRVFGESISGADEIQIYIMVAMAFLGAAIVTWRRMHLRMDVLAQMLPALLRRWLLALELVALVVLGAFVAFHSAGYARQMFLLDRRSDNAEIPMWIPHGAVAVGFFLIALFSLWRLVRVLCADPAELAPAGDAAGANPQAATVEPPAS
jgi:C4-dicarboxylate transporter DctQ subunit